METYFQRKKAGKESMLAHLHFGHPPFWQKTSLWPGSKGLARKKHRPSYFGLRISDFFGFLFQSAIRIPHFGGGPIGRYRIRNFYFFFSNPHSAIGIPHFNCPPGPRNERCLMIFSRRALTSGPGNA
jgi:hypothetical protein